MHQSRQSCARVICTGRARIGEVRWPHLLFCDRRCQTIHHLGETARVTEGTQSGVVTLKVKRATMRDVPFAITVSLNLPENALADDTDELLGLARGTLCWPVLRMAYNFPEEYSFLHWFDFEIPVDQKYAEDAYRVSIFFRLPGKLIGVSRNTLIIAAQKMTKTYNESNVGALLQEDLLDLAQAVRTEDYERYKSSDESDLYVYKRVSEVIAHLMYLQSTEVAEAIRDAVIKSITGASQAVLVVSSVQDYVATAMRPLSALGQYGRRYRSDTINVDRELVFSLPPLSDENWPMRIAKYVNAQEYTPASGMIKKADCVSIVAREPGDDGALLGYITCTLYSYSAPIAGYAFEERSPFLSLFASREASKPVFNLMVIAGLSVDTKWRGGRGDSVAVLLVFQALYFAMRCNRDFGLCRVSCESAARTTMLIMRQFGASFVSPIQSIKWMHERQEKGLSCAEDLLAFIEEFEGADRVMASGTTEQEKVALLTQAYDEHIAEAMAWRKKASYFYDLLNYDGNNTYLYIGPENRKFHEEMARVERLLTGHQVIEKTRQPEDADDLQGDDRRKRVKATGAPLVTLSLASLNHFAPQW